MWVGWGLEQKKWLHCCKLVIEYIHQHCNLQCDIAPVGIVNVKSVSNGSWLKPHALLQGQQLLVPGLSNWASCGLCKYRVPIWHDCLYPFWMTPQTHPAISKIETLCYGKSWCFHKCETAQKQPKFCSRLQRNAFNLKELATLKWKVLPMMLRWWILSVNLLPHSRTHS